MQNPLLSRDFSKIFWRLNQMNHFYPKSQRFFLGASGLSIVYYLRQIYQRGRAEEDILFRKAQLSQQIYELRDDELVNPPWNSQNYREWLYRPIRIRGRPLHYKGMYVPRRENGKDGFEYIVPFVTKENQDQSVQEGVLLSLGFIPHEFKEIANRKKIEDAHFQTFDCFASELIELQNVPFYRGNNTIDRDPEWTHPDLDKMAESTGFVNKDKIKKVVLERVVLETPNNERDCRLYDIQAGHQEDYPYLKTRSGALFTRNHMPYDWQRRANNSLIATALFGSLGFALQLLK